MNIRNPDHFREGTKKVVEDEKEVNMKNKPLREWTLKEVQELCDNQDDCPGCPCYTAENGCMFSGEATSWPLSETEAMSARSAGGRRSGTS